MSLANMTGPDWGAPPPAQPEEPIAPVPRVSIQAFCESPDVAAVIQATAEDRRMGKAHVKIQMGGAPAALEAYRSAPTPNVLLLEAEGNSQAILGQLDQIAEFCDPGTRVIVMGRVNDVQFYRELVKRGVSEYLMLPISIRSVLSAISGLYNAPGTQPVGRTLAVIGAKGGVGASTVAHNISWSISRILEINTVVADMDLAFGTAGLDYNQDPTQGIADAVFSPDRIDSAFIDRLLSKCADRLSLLSAPASLERVYDFGEEAFEPIVDVLRATVPFTVMDLPHQWSAWTRRTLISADEILIVAAPDLANLRNAKNLCDLLKAARPNDSAPRYVINMVGVPKRPEVQAQHFVDALGVAPFATLPFDPGLFATAANNGQMIAEAQASSKAAAVFDELARAICGRTDPRKAPSKSLLAPLVARFRRQPA